MAATVVGLIVFTLLTGVLGVMCIAGMIASESSAKDVSDNTVMVLNLSGVLNERSERKHHGPAERKYGWEHGTRRHTRCH